MLQHVWESSWVFRDFTPQLQSDGLECYKAFGIALGGIWGALTPLLQSGGPECYTPFEIALGGLRGSHPLLQSDGLECYKPFGLVLVLLVEVW